MLGFFLTTTQDSELKSWLSACLSCRFNKSLLRSLQ